jgi:CHAD domain-containing protein
MALTFPLPSGSSEKRIGLPYWMDRVVELAEVVQSGWDADQVHDLRVALRRCRTMADALSDVNPSSGWRKLRKASRFIFDALGDLRDAQVEQAWVRKLGVPGDPVRKRMLRLLSSKEQGYRKGAEKALDEFDRKNWRKWARRLQSKAQLFPPESVVFQRQALASLNEAVELYGRARRGRSRIAWHRLRIGIKRFRYVVENFLPQRYEAWAEDLKRMQDLLGDVHDLDVLRSEIRLHCSELRPGVVAPWFERIEAERKARLREFRSKAADKESLWLVWRTGFQWGHELKPASLSERQTA